MKLSIGMIVKNEEKYLDRCLSAMKPILDSVDSELIIADTGSTDRTVEIAKKYTDNVFYFEWINDFAAARNSTLKRAKGEWFMYVDADEIFSSCDELISFFNSGEYKKYNTATFIQRNYTSKEMRAGSFGDFNAPRLAKLTPDIEFELPIHEGFNYFRGPVKIINAVADHFGYIHDDDENTAKKKCERNAPLLLKRLENEKDPKSLLYMQLFEAFFETDEKRAMEFLDIGIELSIKERSCMVPAFYKKKAVYEYNRRNYAEAIRYLDEYLYMEDKNVKPNLTGSDGEFTSFKAHILDCMGRYADAVTEYVKFFKLFKDYCSGKLDTNDLMMYELHYLAKDKLWLNHREFLYCCVKAKKYNTALQYLKLLPIDKCPDNAAYINERIRNEVYIAENTSFKNLKALHSQLPEKHRDYFYRFIRARIFSNENKDVYIKSLLDINSSDSFREIIEIIKNYIGGNDISAEAVRSFADRYGTANYPELLYILMAQKKDIAPLAGCSDFDPAKMSFSCGGDYEGFYNTVSNYDVSVCSPECLEALAEIVKTAIVCVCREKESAAELLVTYAAVAQAAQPDLTDETVSKAMKGAAAAYDIVTAYRSKAYKECIGHMRELLRIFPEFKPVISEYQDLIKDALGMRDKAQQELASMAAIVKRNVRIMIKDGNISGAMNTLQQLSQLCPNDPDIAEFMESIEEKAPKLR